MVVKMIWGTVYDVVPTVIVVQGMLGAGAEGAGAEGAGAEGAGPEGAGAEGAGLLGAGLLGAGVGGATLMGMSEGQLVTIPGFLGTSAAQIPTKYWRALAASSGVAREATQSMTFLVKSGFWQ